MKMESNPIFTFLPTLLLVKSEQRASHTFWEWKEGEKSRVGVWRKREREREGLVKNHSAGVCLSVLLSACLMHVCIHCAHDTVCMRVCFPLLLFFLNFTEWRQRWRISTQSLHIWTCPSSKPIPLCYVCLVALSKDRFRSLRQPPPYLRSKHYACSQLPRLAMPSQL